jgi:hypothetical protein
MRRWVSLMIAQKAAEDSFSMKRVFRVKVKALHQAIISILEPFAYFFDSCGFDFWLVTSQNRVQSKVFALCWKRCHNAKKRFREF